MAITPINGLSSSSGPFGIDPVQGVGPTAPATTAAEESSSADDAVSVETSSASPPPEVMAAIAHAAAAFDDLASQGLHVSFDDDPAGGGLSMSLQGHDGTVLSALSGSDVLALADGSEPQSPGGVAPAT